jgi:TonB family protein
MLVKSHSKMKTLRLLLLPAAICCGSLAADAQFATQDYAPMRFFQTESPVFPEEALAQGYRSGVVQVAVQVDASGVLTDYLVTTYTHPAFARNAVAAVKKWRFEPARIHGEPRGAKADLTFNFDTEGTVVVNMTVTSSAELLHFSIVPDAQAFRARTLSELDRTPMPIKFVKPVYPMDLARSSHGGHVTVEFYIDELGHVRLASVDRQTIEANEELAAIAVTTVEQWQFEPPLYRGRPVLTLAQQDFNFKP